MRGLYSHYTQSTPKPTPCLRWAEEEREHTPYTCRCEGREVGADRWALGGVLLICEIKSCFGFLMLQKCLIEPTSFFGKITENVALFRFVSLPKTSVSI